MLGNFTYYNPTKLYFGGGSVASLRDELPKYGPNIVLVYGGGSIKTNGIYDQVTAILKDCGKNVAEISGVMPNPTLPKVLEGVEICRRHQADFLLAVGAGPSATTPRPWPPPSTVRRTPGRSISSALRNLPAPSSPWAVC